MTISSSLVVSLMIWISTMTGYVVPDPPKVGYKTESELTRILYNCTHPTELTKLICDDIISNKGKHVFTKHHRTLAIYNNVLQQIYIKKGLEKSYNKVVLQSILLHELIHHMQYQNKVNFSLLPEKGPCIGKYEQEAYYLQNIWLLKQGQKTVFEALDLDSLYLMMLFSCEDYNYFGSFDKLIYQKIH